ncbi:MAG: hypothetical protein M1511_04795 [Deltaproteobacteria bacterium]|nr:hypothetical protein [Deltaproteobacteria bacterium]
MRTWLQKLERMAAATAFAEEGEWQMAQSVIEEPQKRPVTRDVEREDRRKARPRGRAYRA